MQSSNQSSQNSFSTFQATNKTHHNALNTASDVSSSSSATTFYANTTNQIVYQSISDAHQSSRISTMGQAESHGKNIPPSSLPLTNQGTQPFSSQQVPLCSPHYLGGTVPFELPYTHQGLQNGFQSPNQKDIPLHLPSFGHCVNQCTPLRAFEGVNGVNSHGSSSFPIQQQPQWMLPPDTQGAIKDCVHNVAAHPYKEPMQEGNVPQSPSSESRYGLDPKLLPSAVKVMAEDRAEWEGKVFMSEPFSRLPPLATTPCVIEDKGSASPFAIHCTLYRVPCEGQAVLLSHLPLGALVTPLAKQTSVEKFLPVCRESYCVRGCGWCGASMCAAMSWQDCGQRFYCPFCGKLSEVPWQHYQPTEGVEGCWVDKDKRPELSLGSYEILHSQKLLTVISQSILLERMNLLHCFLL
ncbi:hypothetical protein LDENG_00003000 [Lucifuga dentata]|nr:hypothetical protein LDENG_00003000 [Lucifuga dentata]